MKLQYFQSISYSSALKSQPQSHSEKELPKMKQARKCYKQLRMKDNGLLSYFTSKRNKGLKKGLASIWQVSYIALKENPRT